MELAYIEEIDRKRYKAMERGDIDALETMLSDRLVYLHSTTILDDKTSYVGNIRSGLARYISCETEPLCRGAHSDEVVWLLDRVRMVGEFKGVTMHLDNLIMATWGREGADWRLLAVQSTPVRDGKTALEPRQESDNA